MENILVLCVTVFFFRIIDMTLGTLRTVFNVKGKIAIATGIAFVEAIVYFTVIKDALTTDVESIWIVLSFAGGFACGVFVGGTISSKIVGVKNIQLQIITKVKNEVMIQQLRDKGFAVTVVDVKKSNLGDEQLMLFLEIRKSELKNVKELVLNNDREAFVMINESMEVLHGYFMGK